MAAKKRSSAKTSKTSTTKARAKAAPKRKGRPPRAGEAANRTVLVRFTATEFARVSDAARADGKTLAAFARERVLDSISN